MREFFFLNSEIGMVRSGIKVFRRLASHLSPPFIIDDHRFGLVTHGEAHVTVNLQEKTFRAGMMAYLAPGSIVTDVHFSPDFDMRGLDLFATFPLPFPSDRMPVVFNGEIRDIQCQADEQQLDVTHRLMDLIWQIVTSSENYDRPTLNSLVAALMNHYDCVYRAHARTSSYTREQTIYDRFIYLVSRHAKQQHQLGFYAGALPGGCGSSSERFYRQTMDRQKSDCLSASRVEAFRQESVTTGRGNEFSEHLVSLQVFQTHDRRQSVKVQEGLGV